MLGLPQPCKNNELTNEIQIIPNEIDLKFYFQTIIELDDEKTNKDHKNLGMQFV